MSAFDNAFDGKTVLITGHTGFKGSWLSIWLSELGANVVGYSLAPPTDPSNFELTHLAERITHIHGDVRELAALQQTIAEHKPEIVFHLAAQTIVLTSFKDPHETLNTNVMGTVNVLEAIRSTASVRAVVCITTDKVYENREWLWGYREDDRLGGHDPYSASKAMAELGIASYRNSFFNAANYDDHRVAVASSRAGNVIGGGDLADFRLVPDCMRALIGGEPIAVRNPGYVRPWQHVLEALSGYMWLAVKLRQDGPHYAEAWNLGPLEVAGITAQAIAEKCIALWGSGEWYHVDPDAPRPKETAMLRLSWEKAAARLGWYPAYTWEDALTETVAWFKAYRQQQAGGVFDMYPVCVRHIADYTARARARGLAWAKG